MSKESNRCLLSFAQSLALVCGLVLGAGAVNAKEAKGKAAQTPENASAAIETADAETADVETNVVVETPPAPVAGLRISNALVEPRDEKTATVKFDIVWSNSWRWGSFFDAAWVFFKFKAEGAAEWQHVRLSAGKVLNPEGYGQENGTKLEFLVPDGDDPSTGLPSTGLGAGGAGGFVGMIVRRAADGVGAVAARNVTAVWDFTASKGIAKDTKVRILPFGVEMVYVPEGAFYVGKGNAEPLPWAGMGYGGMELNWLYRHDGNVEDTPSGLPFKFNIPDVYHWGMSVTRGDTPPYRVTSAGAIPTGRQKGSLWAVADTPADNGEIPAAFPNGYAGFYCMKHPYLTQAHYAAFLNTLTEKQAHPRYYAGLHGVAIKRSGKSPHFTYSASDPDGRFLWLSFADGAAWAAWAGLRPMTELEYEKCIRGPRVPIPNDASPSYWGVDGVQGMYICERPITVGNAMGRAFKGTHGRGVVELPADWPDVRGVVFRGDYFGPSWCPTHLLSAGRVGAVYAGSDRNRGLNFCAGWRGARSAPAGDTGVTPVTGELDLRTLHPERLKNFRADGTLDEWGKPSVTIGGPAHIFPTQLRTFSTYCSDPWRGDEDLSAKVHLGWDGEALCVAAEVRDDRHFNGQTGENIWNGDCMQMGLVNAAGGHRNFVVALTTNGVAFHQLDGKGDELPKTATRAVVRDETAKTTRYEMRLPLAAVEVKPGTECSFYFQFYDDDDGKGQRKSLQWLPDITEPFRRSLYPRFVLGE